MNTKTAPPKRRLVQTTKLRRGVRPVLVRARVMERPTYWVWED